MRCQPYKARRADYFGKRQRDGQIVRAATAPRQKYTSKLASYPVPDFGSNLDDERRLRNEDLAAMDRYELACERSALFAGINEARSRLRAHGIQTIVIVGIGAPVPFEAWAKRRLQIIGQVLPHARA